MRAAFALLCLCGSAVANADSTSGVSFHVVNLDGRPKLVAALEGAVWVPPSAIRVYDDGNELPVAVETHDFASGNEPLALAIVVNGQEIWMGNDDVEVDDNARYPGALKGLERAIDGLDLRHALPAGSRVSLITYADGAELRARDVLVERFTAAMLGSQADYRGKIGDDLVAGVQLAINELSRTPATHKALVVIGDGSDTNNEAAKAELARLKDKAAVHGIETFAIIYKSAVSAADNVIAQLVPSAVTMNSIDGVGAALADTLVRITDRYYLTFAHDGLPWDGVAHDLTLELAGHKLSAESVVLPAAPRTAPWWRSRWLDELAIGTLFVGLLALGARWRVRAGLTRYDS